MIVGVWERDDLEYVFGCVCVCEREREREGGRYKEKEGERVVGSE